MTVTTMEIGRFRESGAPSARSMVESFVREHGSITVSQFRDLSGSSRKYALPLMEYFDSVRFTRRVGDARVLASPN